MARGLAGTGAVYSDPRFNALLGVADQISVTIVAEDAVNTPTLRVALEHSNNDADWVAKTALVDALALTAKSVVATGADPSGLPNAAYVRLRVELTGDAPAANVRLVATGRLLDARSTVIWAADFTGLALGAATALPAGLALSRASSATVQTSAVTVVTSGITTDVARVGSDGTRLGLVLEESRTNVTPTSRDPTSASWSAASSATITRPTGSAPDGDTATATEMNVSANGYGRYVATGASVGPSWTLSVWGRAKSGGSATWQMESDAPIAAVATTVSAWTRRTWTRTFATPTNWVPVDARDWSGSGGIVATAQAIVVDLFQVEEGTFTTEAIVNTGTGTATRAGERLWHPSGAALVSAGRLNLEFKLQPKGASGGYKAAMRLWTIDASHYAEIGNVSKQLSVTIGGSTHTFTPTLTWSAGDTVELWLAAGGGSAVSTAQYRVNGGATVSLGSSGAAQGVVAPAGALELLCSGTSQQFSAWVQRVRAYRAGEAPAWTT